MMRMIRKGSSGQVLVLLAMMMLVLLGIAAFALDVGLAYGVKAKLNAAVDAAAIAALRERTSGTGTDSSASTVAENYLTANFPSDAIGMRKPTVRVEVSIKNGAYVAFVTASAVVPTYLARLVGMEGFTVTASAEATRPGMDVALVLDSTGSLAPVFATVQTLAKSFVNRFSEANDRMALVPFATGVGLVDSKGELVLTDGVEICKSSRGFSKTSVQAAINALRAEPYTYTNSELGLRMGVQQLERVASPADRRAIVLFSDGAPNTFTAKFPIDAAGNTASGSLFSGTMGAGPPRILYHSPLTWDSNPTIIPLYKLPEKGGCVSIGSVTLMPEFPITNSKRPINEAVDYRSPQDLKCETNKAARNMLENVANDARERGIVIHAIGFGAMLDQPDISGDCSTSSETGSTVLMRVVNSKDSDTYNAGQRSGIYCRANDLGELGRCFDRIANSLLRLTK